MAPGRDDQGTRSQNGDRTDRRKCRVLQRATMPARPCRDETALAQRDGHRAEPEPGASVAGRNDHVCQGENPAGSVRNLPLIPRWIPIQFPPENSNSICFPRAKERRKRRPLNPSTIFRGSLPRKILFRGWRFTARIFWPRPLSHCFRKNSTSASSGIGQNRAGFAPGNGSHGL